jgi:hypothetical protein
MDDARNTQVHLSIAKKREVTSMEKKQEWKEDDEI